MQSIPDIARATADRHTMFPPESPVVVLVSGGADSVALLRLLADGALGRTGPLSVLHVNHLLRGEAADRDAAFVGALSSEMGLPCTVARFDVAAFAAEEGLNLEDAGRQVRYRFAEELLDATCDKALVSREVGRIAVAHNRDDRVETFFMRAITGSGAGGLSSIPYVRGRVVRPLLDCDREAIRAWMRELGQPWCEDITNTDTARLRALVRAEMVPVAERVNPSVRETLCRSIDLLAADDALLSAMAREFALDSGGIVPGERVELDCRRLSLLDRAMARRTVRAAIGMAFPQASRLEAAHVEALVDGIGREGFARDLPWALRAEREYDRLIILPVGAEPQALVPSVLPLPGAVDLGPAGRIVAEVVPPGESLGSVGPVTVDAGDAEVFVVDAVRPGDRMRPLGMEGTRKLSDLLIDAKVPRRERPVTPVVRDGSRVVWLAGVRMSEEYRVRPETRRVLRLTWDRAGT